MRVYVVRILSLIMIVGGITACSRLAKDLENSFLTIETPSPVHVNQTVTFNVVIEGLTEPTTVEWSVSRGSLASNVGEAVFFEAPAQGGDVVVSVVVTDVDLTIATESIVLTVEEPDILPPATPVNLEGVATDNIISLSWDANTETDLGGYFIYYSKVPDRFLDFVDVGLVTTYDLSNLDNGDQYFVKISAYDTAPIQNESVLSESITRTPDDLVRPGKPLQFVATRTAAGVMLTWQNPADLDLDKVQIRRKLLGFPVDSNDGDLIYEGLAGTVEDTGVENGVEYFYGAFSFDEVPLSSIEPATRNILVKPFNP